jgi:hypothetical protein
MMKDQRLQTIFSALSFFPLVVLAAGFLFVTHNLPFSASDYERYRQFWGGNPSEVFSHWLNMVVMSGNAFSLGWLVALEALARRRNITPWFKTMWPVCLFGSIAAGGALDLRHGEGVVTYVAVVFFLPVLGSWCYLLRKIASFYGWLPKRVIILATLYVVLNIGAQLLYEPSGTGGPNIPLIPIWLGSMASAVVWALVLGVRTRAVGMKS